MPNRQKPAWLSLIKHSQAIVKEAQAHADAATDAPNPETAKLAVARPRYQRARLLGEQPVHGLAKRYLEEAISNA